MQELDAHQTRQLIDCEQAFEAYLLVERELTSRFSGSMAWKMVKGGAYLYRKRANVWNSLGPRNAETEESYARFHEGREAARDRRKSLDDTLRRMAPVNRALRLGRVPFMAARLLRKVERAGLLGRGLKVVGTNAIYAYERMAGVHLGEGAISTMDLDLLYDARVSLKLVSGEIGQEGLIGILKGLDRSFTLTGADSFRAVNDQGYMVDLIMPSRRSPSGRRTKARIGAASDELTAVEIDGLAWLENAPTISRTVIDERGFPLTIVAPDPRAFVCHKAWIGRRDDRDPLKRRRDVQQANMVAQLLVTRLPGMRFDDDALHSLPANVLVLGREIADHWQSRAVRDDSAWDN